MKKKKVIDICHKINPFLGLMAMIVTQDIALKIFFKKTTILNRNFPRTHNSPIILAPTHRSRWDGLIITMAMGRRVTNKDCRFMVTNSEMIGIQGWFLKRLGCFSINQLSPSYSVLRYAVNLIVKKRQRVVFPEGRINKNGKKIPLKEGLFRLAKLATKKTTPITIIPIGIAYSQITPKFRSSVSLCFGKPLIINKHIDLSIDEFNAKLYEKMTAAEHLALKNVGR